MPFTPAHPAVVLPFLKLNPRYVSATGLIIGSMSPDFEYFIKMSVDSSYSHTFLGLIYFDVPVTVLLALAFHLVIKRNLILSLPNFLQIRLQDLLTADFVTYLKKSTPVFLISAWLGALTHVTWDGFTHNSGFFVQKIYFLKASFIPFHGVRYPTWYALQHISTAIGLTILLIYIAFMKPTAGTKTTSPSVLYWLGIAVVAAVTVVARFLVYPLDYSIGNLVVTCITGICLGLIILGLVTIQQKTDQHLG